MAERAPCDRSHELPARSGLLPLLPPPLRDPARRARARVGRLGAARLRKSTSETPPPPRLHGRAADGGPRRLRGRVCGVRRSWRASDVRLLADELERIHPNPYHAVSQDEFRRQVDELAARADGLERDELIVGLMRLMGLLGERDGHSGLYTLHTHGRCIFIRCGCTGSPTA